MIRGVVELAIKKMTGAQILIECLKNKGIDTVFGYPGGAVLPIYDALYREKSIRHVRTSHEQGAAHAADGYARVTGKIGVCFSTSGPGATNLVTGIATAYMDSVPMVAFTGQVPLNLIGKDSFQEVDITGITLPITKHNYMIKKTEDIPRIVEEAFEVASSGRPGPVLVDIPKDVAAREIEFGDRGSVKKRILENPLTHDGFDPEQIEEIVEAIVDSKAPVLYAGGGVNISGAHRELIEIAERCQIPITTTLMGMGAFPSDHPLYLGMLGMHGTVCANYAVTNSDLLIAVGARFDDRVVGKVEEFAPKAKIIHIDIDPAEIGKNVPVDIGVLGDVKKVLMKLLEILPAQKREKWVEQIWQWKKQYPLEYDKKCCALKPQYIIEKICELTRGDAILTTEVGQNQMWAAQFYRFKNPRSLITSGGLGTMGFGLPAAIGAQLGKPDKKVFNISGDGSFKMNCNELETAVCYKLPIIVVILNNRTLGMVRQWQELFYDGRYSQVDFEHSVDFVKLAEAYGAVGYRITTKDEVEDVILKALNNDKPTVIDCIIERDEKVYPMVPAGAPINKMMGID